MKNVNYQGLIILIIVRINSVHTLKAEIKETVTGLLGENGTQIECSYTKENVLRIDSVTFLAFNKNTTTFDTIITYLFDIKPLITSQGQYLKGRVTLNTITQSSKAVVIFNKLLCIDDTFYRCNVRFVDSGGVPRDANSNNISISVQVPPSKPDVILVMNTPEDSTVTTAKSVEYNTSSPSTEYTPKDHETVSTLQSVTTNETTNDTTAFNFSSPTTGHNITYSTPSVYDISSKSSYRTTTHSSKKTTPSQGIVEGDNITIFCIGDVGKPPAKHFFQKYRVGYKIPVNYTASATSISEMSDNCSYYRTSNLTINVKAEDNNAVIRCVVNSLMEGQDMYVETESIKVYSDKSTTSTSGSTSQPSDSDGKKTNWIGNMDNWIVVLIIVVVIVAVVIIAICCYLYKWIKKDNSKSVDKIGSKMNLLESQKTASGESSPNSTNKTSAYEDVDLDHTDVKVKSTSNKETPAEVKQHNEDYLKKQKEDEEKEKDNPTTPPAAVVYSFVNKPKNTTETKTPSDQKEEDVYEEPKEGLYDTSGDRRHKVPNTAEHYDTTENIKKEESDNGDLSSAQKDQIGSLANKSFENNSELKKEEKRQVATVSPIVRTSFESKGDGQSNNINKQNCKNVKPEDQAGLTEVVPVFPTERSSLESQGEGQTNKSNDIQPMNNYQNVKSEDQTGLTEEVPVSPTERSSLESEGEGQKNKSTDNCNNVKPDDQTCLTEVAPSSPTNRSSLESQGEGQKNKSNDNCINVKSDAQTGLTEVAPSYPTDRSFLESQGEGQTNKSNNIQPMKIYQNVNTEDQTSFNGGHTTQQTSL